MEKVWKEFERWYNKDPEEKKMTSKGYTATGFYAGWVAAQQSAQASGPENDYARGVKDSEIADFEIFHPRAVKLMRKRKNFLVIAEDEPYFVRAYRMIRKNEMANGTWSKEDERIYQSAQQDMQASAPKLGERVKQFIWSDLYIASTVAGDLRIFQDDDIIIITAASREEFIAALRKVAAGGPEPEIPLQEIIELAEYVHADIENGVQLNPEWEEAVAKVRVWAVACQQSAQPDAPKACTCGAKDGDPHLYGCPLFVRRHKANH